MNTNTLITLLAVLLAGTLVGAVVGGSRSVSRLARTETDPDRQPAGPVANGIPARDLPARLNSPIAAVQRLDIRQAELPGLIDELLQSGVDPLAAGTAALAMWERFNAPVSSPERLLAQLDIEEALLARGVDVPSQNWDSHLAFLGDEYRRGELKVSLSDFDQRMRALERAQAEGSLEGSDYFEKWDALRRDRQEALLAQLTPEEAHRWVVEESPTAQMLRQLPIFLPPSEFEQVVVLKHEAARQLEDPNLGDSEREHLQAQMDAKLTSVLSDDDFAQLRRAEDTRYGAYLELGEQLGVTADVANQIYDLQRQIQERETALRSQGMPDDEVLRHMQQVVGQASGAIRETLGNERFERFLEQPQSVFLMVYQPLSLVG